MKLLLLLLFFFIGLFYKIVISLSEEIVFWSKVESWWEGSKSIWSYRLCSWLQKIQIKRLAQSYTFATAAAIAATVENINRNERKMIQHIMMIHLLQEHF